MRRSLRPPPRETVMAPPDRRALRVLPRFEWTARQRAEEARRARLRRRLRFAATGALSGLVLASAALPPAPLFVWNASASAPTGLYFVSPGASIHAGDMVIARTPAPWRMLAARRHYLPANVPLVKRAVAAEGDIVCAHDEHVSINGMPAVTRRVRDGAGRILPWWEGCRALRQGELFLLMADAQDSFDGRYFGVTGPGDVVGKARLIWAR